MTQLARADARKLDADLLYLLSEGAFAERATFPVIVTHRPGLGNETEALVVALQGQLRHRLTSIAAVSAWLTASAIVELSRRDLIEELELAQPMRIASGTV